MIGRTLEHYRIEAKLGEGGMGIVYKAHDPRLNRPVAIKVLPAAQAQDATAKQRFIHEAKAASALNHPGIVTIHDIRRDGDTDFIVMEFIAGQTLDALTPVNGMRVDQLLRYGIQIADALAAAHASGIIHRDLKPSNVMETQEGRIKVLDFGLAKLLERGERSSNVTTVAAPRTEAHWLLGTAAYMSPEQAEGRTLDARSDIFSVGIMLYEMATGVRPFAGESRLSLLAKTVGEEPAPPSARVPSIPLDLEKTILRCLRKEPNRRYQTMADLKVALEDIAEETTTTRPKRAGVASPAKWRWLSGVGLLAVLAAAYSVWQQQSTIAPAPLKVTSLTTFAGPELYPSLSPDGNHVAFTWSGHKQDNTDIYVQQIGAGDPLRVTTDPHHDYNPVWSPDGRWIAFLRGDAPTPLATSVRELRLVAPLGGPERMVASLRVQELTEHPAYLTWCADSSCVIVSDSLGERKPDALFAISIDTSEKRQLTNPQPPVLADSNPALSFDGSTLLFIRRTTWSSGELHTVSLAPKMTMTTEPRHIAVSGVKIDTATWLPDSEILFSTPVLSGTTNLWRVPAIGGAPTRLAYTGEDGTMPTVARGQSQSSSRMVYVRRLIDDNIWQMTTTAPGLPPASPPTAAIRSTKQDIHPQLSPDGKRLAYTSTRSGFWEIWVSDLDGANAVQLTDMRAPTGTGVPHWSPDGHVIVFASDVEGQFDIFVVPAAGGKVRNLTSHPAFDHVPAFSRDGKWVYFSSSRSGTFQIWRMPAAGGEPVQVTKDGGFFSQDSPNGADLYFMSTAGVGAITPIWRMPTSGGQAVKVIDGAVNGGFAVVTRGIYFLDLVAGVRIQFYDFATRRATVVARDLGPGAEMGGFHASADGRTILFVRRESAVDDLMLVENFR
jgi:serine/threonine protein kinase